MKNRLLLTFLLLMPACLAIADEKPAQQTQTAPQTQEVVAVNYEVIQQGTYSGMKESFAGVIKNKKDWQDLWKKHVGLIVPQPPLPEVNFDNEVVAAIFAGEKRTSGYQILPQEIKTEGNDVVLRYRQTEPPANSFTLQVLTQPHLMIKIQKPKNGIVKLLKE